MGQANFKVIEKRLEKKNAELLEVRGLRQKLFEREKEITAEIEKLKNQKIELIFMAVKKEMKTEKLEITSEAIMPLLEVLRNGNATLEENSESEVAKGNDISVNETLKIIQK